jgi:hypothetical protein
LGKQPNDVDKLPENIDIPRFYRYAVFIVFAVVIAESFPQSVNVFIVSDNKSNNFLDHNRIEDIFVLIVAYFFIIAGWLNYFKVSVVSPHSESGLGTARFVVDLFIIYLYYYLLKIIPGQTHHGQIFVWIFPFIFGSFLLWDILRFYEYQKNVELDEKQGMKGRVLLTLATLIVVVVEAIFYTLPRGSLLYENVSVWNFLFIAWSFGIVLFYRWTTRSERRTKIRRG